MSAETQELKLMRLLGNSLICLSGKCVPLNEAGEPDGDEQAFGCTSFAMSFGGVPVLVTAGHVIDDFLDPLVVRGEYEGRQFNVTECNLCDFFGVDPKVIKPIPFDYAGTPRASINQSLDQKSQGLDFGILLLRPFYWRGLEANHVTPIGEERWLHDAQEQFDVYKMIGFPENFALAKRGLVQTTCYTVTKATDPDVATPDGQPVWFVGRLPDGVNSVRGVSGGPIFGFRRVGDNLWDYRVVAMQSWQNRTQRMVYGTPLQSFAPRIADVIERLRRQAARGDPEANGKPDAN
jgi:hypothetical protein